MSSYSHYIDSDVATDLQVRNCRDDPGNLGPTSAPAISSSKTLFLVLLKFSNCQILA